MNFTEAGNNTVHPLIPRPNPHLLSLVMPAYNEEAVIPFLRDELGRFLASLPYACEVIIVNDGSKDRTLELLVAWAREDPRIRIVHLSRNFGHQIAATAGLDHAVGDAIVLIDADLQDPLEVIGSMVDLYRQGFDVVYGQRESRTGEGRLKLATAWLFYRLMRSFVYRDLPRDVGDFRLISRKALAALRQMQEQHRFIRGMVTWLGFPQTKVVYRRAKRAAGETKYPLSKMLKFAWTAAVSFSTLPLKASIILGLIVAGLGVEEGVRATAANLLGWQTVRGWSSLMIFESLVGGTMLICLGVLGEYVGRIYEESKRRPLYFVSATLNMASAIRPEAEVLDGSETKPQVTQLT